MKLETQKQSSFHEQLRNNMDTYVHLVYQNTKTFPREEIYGVTSQLRRSALSVILNYIEGYARNRNKVHKNFIETAYGSLKESRYLIEFSHKEKFVNDKDFQVLIHLADEIGAMLWGMLKKLPT